MLENTHETIAKFMETTIKSWTFEKLTEKERDKLYEVIESARDAFDVIKGNEHQRVRVLNAIYYAYLVGLGYDGVDWRA